MTGESGADELVYDIAVGTTYTASGGGDQITGFRRGEDVISFQTASFDDGSGNSAADRFALGANGTDGNPFTSDDRLLVRVEFEKVEEVWYVSAVQFHFAETGVYGGGRISLGIMQISFSDETPLTYSDFLTAIGGETNFHAGRGIIKQLVATNDEGLVTENYLANLFGEGSLQFIEIASAPADAKPTGLTVTVVSAYSDGIAEDTDTSSRIKVADIAVADDGQGTNTLSLSGTDAVSFEIDGTALYLKADVGLDHETAASLSVDVSVAGTGTGTDPDSVTFTLGVTDVNDAPVIGTAIPDQTGTAGQAFSYTIPTDGFTDADGRHAELHGDAAEGCVR